MIEIQNIDVKEPIYFFNVKGVEHKFYFSGGSGNLDLYVKQSNRCSDTKYFLENHGKAEHGEPWNILLVTDNLKVNLEMLYYQR